MYRSFRFGLLGFALLWAAPAHPSPILLEISPSPAVVGQEITLRAVYGFSDTCWQIDGISHGWQEDFYRVSLLSHRDNTAVCLTVLWEHEEIISLGQLPAGIHRVRARERNQGVCDQPGAPPCEEILELEFEVFGSVPEGSWSWGTLKARH